MFQIKQWIKLLISFKLNKRIKNNFLFKVILNLIAKKNSQMQKIKNKRKKFSI